MTVDAGGEVLTLLTHAPALHVAVDVHAELHHVHRLVVLALVGVTIAVAGLALEPVISSVASPLLLSEPVLTLLAVDALGDNVKWQVHICTLLCLSVPMLVPESCAGTRTAAPGCWRWAGRCRRGRYTRTYRYYRYCVDNVDLSRYCDCPTSRRC